MVKLDSINSRQKLLGIRDQILKGSGMKLVQGGFRGGNPFNDQALVYRRKGKTRYPIEALRGPSMIGSFPHAENLEPLMGMGRPSLETALLRQAHFRLGRVGIL